MTGKKYGSKLILLFSTDYKLEKFKRLGFLSRYIDIIREYKHYFSEVEVYSCDYENMATEEIKHYTLPLRFPPYMKHLLYWLYLLAKAKTMKGIIKVFSSSIPSLFLIRLISRSKTILHYQYDYKQTSRLDYGFLKGLLGGLIEHMTILGADVLAVTTNELKALLWSRYKKESIILPELVDTKLFYPSNEGEDIVLYIGRIYWHKGLDYLLEAHKILEDKYFNISLKIAGYGDIEKYSCKARQIGLKNVEFLGSLEHCKLAELMRHSKIFVLPTITREGQPKALLEAMASGLACIVSDVEGNRSLIKHGWNGLLVPPRDSMALADALYHVLTSTHFYKKLRKNAILTAQKYSLEKVIAQEWENLEKLVLVTQKH